MIRVTKVCSECHVQGKRWYYEVECTMWYALGYTYSIVRAPGKYKRISKALFYEFYMSQ